MTDEPESTTARSTGAAPPSWCAGERCLRRRKRNRSSGVKRWRKRGLATPVVRALLPMLIASGLMACRGTNDERPCPHSLQTPVRAPGLSGRIVFEGVIGGGERCRGLFVMNADGTDARRLTEANVAYFSPMWSPDGRSVIFMGDCVGDGALGPNDIDICSISADGTNLRRLMSGRDVRDPAWAPDGARVSFSRRSPSGDLDIYVAAADGTNERRLTTGPGEKAGASWSPDGKSIAFEGKNGGGRQVYVMDAAGGVPVLLAPGGTYSEGPAWSHDGRRIAFYSDRSGKPESAATKEQRRQPGGDLLDASLPAPDIYTMGADGTDVVRITTDASANYAPAWAPDDRHIAFITDRDGENQIYVMGADGGGQTRLTIVRGESPSWTP